MGIEYQIFNWKEYISLRRFWNMEWKYKTEKTKNEELEEENKKLRERNERLIQKIKEYQEKIDEWNEITDRQNDRWY